MNYHLSLELEDAEFLFSLKPKVRDQVIKYLRHLRAHPFTEGRAKVLDTTGRDIEISIVSHFRILHWSDHAVETIRVVAIELK